MATAFRKTGIDVLGDRPWGTHFCLFYETKADLLDALIPYFKAGLEGNELCVWAISDPLTEDVARNALHRGVGDLDRYLGNGSIEILCGREWYLQDNRVEPRTITAGWHEKVRVALRRGLQGVRISGNAFWLDTDHWPDFKAYEQGLDGSFAGQPLIALCTYPLAESRAADILDVARTHQFAIARRNGAWEVMASSQAHAERHPLTPREREVLAWVARGRPAWKIAEILRITKRTVDEHTQAAMRKLGAANRAHAVAIATRDRLIDMTQT